MCWKCSRFVIRTPTPTDSHLALSLSIFQAVPVMASPLPVSFILVVLLLAKSPLYQAGDCKGHRQVLRGPPGYVTDGAGNYSVNGNCEWLIKGGENGFCHYFFVVFCDYSKWYLSNSSYLPAPNNSHRIVLNFTFMNTECTYDYLFVYDGDSYQSPLLASLSGHTLPQPVEAKSGKVTKKRYHSWKARMILETSLALNSNLICVHS